MATKLTTFQIGIPGTSSGSTNQLYANGRQRCQVEIKILKVRYDEASFSWKKESLTTSEIQSLTVLPYSDLLFPAQASGWSCHDAQGDYTPGLWRVTRESAEAPSSMAETLIEEASRSTDNQAPEVFYRYMQSSMPETRRFMACVTLDGGQKYSTHYSTPDASFESYIDIQSQNPYQLRVADLSESRQDAYTKEYEKGKWVDVDTYYWALPGGLRIHHEEFSGAGYWTDKLMYSYHKETNGELYLGMAVKVGVTSLILADMYGSTPNPYDQVPLINTNTSMRGTRYNVDKPGGSYYDNRLYWTIIDNYGCASRFVLIANTEDKGNTLKLENG